MTALVFPAPGVHSVVGGSGAIDRDAAALAIRELLRALGHNPDGEHLADTPRGVADAYAELLTPQAFNPTTFANEEHYDELVLARDRLTHDDLRAARLAARERRSARRVLLPHRRTQVRALSADPPTQVNR